MTKSRDSATFTAQTLHGRYALMSEKLSIGKKNHGSCVNNESRYRFKYETQCCLGHLGQGVASEKDCVCSVYLVLLSEAVAPLLFLLKYSGTR